MKLVDSIHGSYVHNRRVGVLARHIAPLLPEHASVLDVGCGDGVLARVLLESRPDLTLEGLEVLVRDTDTTLIRVRPFDGKHIPIADQSVDVVLFVDVIHHADDGLALLREAARVARKAVIIKDHLNDAFLAQTTLAFMDRVGNARHGVALPFHYWSKAHWDQAFGGIGMKPDAWVSDLGLYPAWADWVFGRSLHFIARLVKTNA